MKTSRLFTVLAAIVLVATQVASADDLGLVSVQSTEDAEVAESIFGKAYARSGNSFLVSVNDATLARAQADGLEVEPLVENVDLDELYIVLGPEHPSVQTKVDPSRFGELITLDNGLQLLRAAPSKAASLMQTGEFRLVPLRDWQIRFKYVPAVAQSELPQDFPTDSLVSRVSQDSLYAYNKRLVDFQTRYAYSDSIMVVRDWLVQKFSDFGYTDVTTSGTEYGGVVHYNVHVVKPGFAEPDAVIVIGAHYDSAVRSSQCPGPMFWAPGADDNGSGTALIMELARILADVPLRKTIVFISFAAEEPGLVGSRFASEKFVASGTNLEVMYNYDMVGNASDTIWGVNLSSGVNDSYALAQFNAGYRTTSLIPVLRSTQPYSDNRSFDQQGFNIVATMETDFSPQYHSNTDVTDSLNFPYLAEVTKMAVASAAAVAEGTYPATVSGIRDGGNGQSLEVHCDYCAPDVDYTVYWGTESGVYTDSVLMPAGDCSVVFDGLTEGVVYYFLAIGEAPNGNRAYYGIEGCETPLVVPRPPANFRVFSDTMEISLSWATPSELDISHYDVYRRMGSLMDPELYLAGHDDTSLIDQDIVSQVRYSYYVTAVDHDGNESAASPELSICPASFDGGIVLVDEFTTELTFMPDQPEQDAYFDTIFDTVGFTLQVADENGAVVSKQDICRFSSLVWIDDDYTSKSIGNNEDVLSWFADHNSNLLVAGFRTIQQWSPSPIPTDHFLHREFQLESYQTWTRPDFIGAHGQEGWPDLQKGPGRGPMAFGEIPRLTPLPGATVIYTYDSDGDRVETKGQPCGILYDGPDGKRILLSFPLWYLTTESVSNLIAKVISLFGGSLQNFEKGDLDNSGTIDIYDVTLLIVHLYVDLEPLDNPQEADMDGYPGVDIGDLTYLIRYLFLGGPSPVPSYGG